MSHADSAAMITWTKAMPFKVVKKSTGSSLLVPVPSMYSTTDWQAGCGVKVWENDCYSAKMIIFITRLELPDHLWDCPK